MSHQGNASSGVAAAVSSEAVLASLAAAALGVIDQADAIISAPTTAQDPAAAEASIVHDAAESEHSSGDTTWLLSGPANLPSRVHDLLTAVAGFISQHVLPAEEELERHAAGVGRWTIHPLVEQLKMKVCNAAPPSGPLRCAAEL
jgi:hypothetical protein